MFDVPLLTFNGYKMIKFNKLLGGEIKKHARARKSVRSLAAKTERKTFHEGKGKKIKRQKRTARA